MSLSLPLKTTIHRPTGNSNFLPYPYSVLTTGTDAGRLIFSATSAWNITNGTLACWFKSPVAGGLVVINEFGSSNNDRCGFYLSGNAMLVTLVRGGSVILNSSVGFTNDGNWHHVVMTFDATSQQTYIDGALKATFASDCHLTVSSPQLVYGGAFSTTLPSICNVTGVVLTNTKSTQSQVSALYYNGAMPVSTLARYDFSNGQGAVTLTAGQGNTGALGTGSWSTVVPTKGVRALPQYSLIF